MTTKEYAEKHGISERTVYRLINDGKLDAQKIEGRWHINQPENLGKDNNELVKVLEQKQELIEYLKNELAKANETLADERKRHDTIVMQITRQLEQKTLALDEMQNRSWWRRVKMALGFSVS